jgi:predicted amidophosphoribosyltransferase
LDGVYSGWYFNEQIQRVIHSLKYEERATLGWELGHHLGNMLPLTQVGDLDFLIPVPLHSVKKRERGIIRRNGLRRDYHLFGKFQ